MSNPTLLCFIISQCEKPELFLINRLIGYRPETYSEADIDALSNKPLNEGDQLDPHGSPKKNEGFFEKALLKAPENEMGGREVKVVANGHCHRKHTHYANEEQ